MTGYISNIPAGGDNLSTSQGQMQTNFGVLQSLYSIDHTGWTNVAGNGTHKKVTFNDVAAPGVPVSPATFAYTKTVGTPSREELFFRNSFAETQVTSNGNDIWKGSAAPGGNGEVVSSVEENGYMILPNGLIFQWGIVSPIVTGVTTDTPYNINFPTASFNVTATLIAPGFTTNAQTIAIRAGSVGTSSPTNKTRFRYDYSGGSAYNSFFWYAIGN